MKKLNIPNRVIVACSQNFNGYGMLRSIGELGIKPTLLINRCNNPLIELSRFKGSIYFYDSVNQIPTLLLDNFFEDAFPPVVICCDDAIQSACDLKYDMLKDKFILSHIGHKQGEITRMMHKEIQMELASKCGITVPMTWLFHKGEIVHDDVVYPCFAKTAISIEGTKADMRICNNKDELQSLVYTKDYLVQEYIKKDYEIIMWGTSLNEKIYFITGISHKVRHLPVETGMTSFGFIEDFKNHPTLNISAVKEFLKNLNYIGMFSIEMAVKDDKYYFLEINLRNDGLQHISTVAGANLPEIYIKSMLGMPVEIPEVKYPTYYMGELTDCHHIGKGVSFKEWLRDFRRTDSFFIANWKDPLPFVSELWTKVKDTIRYRFGKAGK